MIKTKWVPTIEHETVLISFNEMDAQIDIELAPIILWLWKQGIETTYCCQGYRGEQGADRWERVAPGAYISFAPGNHASRFVKALVAIGFPENIMSTVFNSDPDMWHWECKYNSCGDFSFVCRFPNKDISEIVNLLISNK